MPYHRVLRLVLLLLCGVLVPAVLAGKELGLHLKPKKHVRSLTNLPLSLLPAYLPPPQNIHKCLLNCN